MSSHRLSWASAAMWAATGLLVVAAVTAVEAQSNLRLEDSAIFIEINDTDGDAGIQVFLDGKDWDTMNVFDPDGNEILNLLASGSLGLQGATELFFESAEPSFDVQTLDELLQLFPEGTYTFRGQDH